MGRAQRGALPHGLIRVPRLLERLPALPKDHRKHGESAKRVGHHHPSKTFSPTPAIPQRPKPVENVNAVMLVLLSVTLGKARAAG